MPERADSYSGRAKTRTTRILLVDDDKDLLMGLRVRLTACGFEIDCAEDGIGAIRSASQRIPDIIILDLSLPAGGGFQVLEWLRAHATLKDIPVIVVTARDATHYKMKALVAGAAAFFQKPVDNYELLATLADIIERTQSSVTSA